MLYRDTGAPALNAFVVVIFSNSKPVTGFLLIVVSTKSDNGSDQCKSSLVVSCCCEPRQESGHEVGKHALGAV